MNSDLRSHVLLKVRMMLLVTFCIKHYKHMLKISRNITGSYYQHRTNEHMEIISKFQNYITYLAESQNVAIHKSTKP
jgi:hypothetical protein